MIGVRREAEHVGAHLRVGETAAEHRIVLEEWAAWLKEDMRLDEGLWR